MYCAYVGRNQEAWRNPNFIKTNRLSVEFSLNIKSRSKLIRKAKYFATSSHRKYKLMEYKSLRRKDQQICMFIIQAQKTYILT